MTREALHPKAVHDLKQLISKVVEWEEKLDRMAAEHKETLHVIWKMAALMELCPPPPPPLPHHHHPPTPTCAGRGVPEC